MKNNNCFTASEAQQAEVNDTLSGLDDVHLKAFIAVMHGLTHGKSFLDAVGDGNIILVDNGENPVSYPISEE